MKIYLVLCCVIWNIMGKSPDDLDEVASTFEKCIDTNNDGQRTKSEMTSFLNSHRPLDKFLEALGGRQKYVNAFFKEYDLNGDGIVDDEEIKKLDDVYKQIFAISLKTGTASKLHGKIKSMREIIDFFGIFDLDSNGVTTAAELSNFYDGHPSYKPLLHKVGGKESVANNVIFAHDLDNNSEVSREELLKYAEVQLQIIKFC